MDGTAQVTEGPCRYWTYCSSVSRFFFGAFYFYDTHQTFKVPFKNGIGARSSGSWKKLSLVHLFLQTIGKAAHPWGRFPLKCGSIHRRLVKIVLHATGALSHEWRENTHTDCCVYSGCRNKETYVTQRVWAM
jgi:hypothetical protein